MNQDSDATPRLTAKQTEALDVLVDLFRQSRKDNPEARAAFFGVALLLAQQNVLDYLVAALMKQAQALNIPPTKSLLFRDMAFAAFVPSESSAVTKGLTRFRLNDDNHPQAPVILGEVVFQCSGVAAFPSGIVNEAYKGPAILVRLIAEDVFGELRDEFLLTQAFAGHFCFHN